MSSKGQKTRTMLNSKLKRPWFPVLLLIAGVFLYYGNTINNGFSLDDDLVTTTDIGVHERVEKGISGISEIFSTHYVDTQKQKYEYRPIVTASFALQYHFFGNKSLKERASISHLISVMLYALTIVLIYLLIFKLFPDKNWVLPFLIAALFLIHPIHSEVVNNIKCRDELLVMIFGLLAIFSFLNYIDSNYKKLWYLVAGVLLIIISILSKKVGITFLVLVPLIIFYFREIKLKKLLFFIGLIFVTVIIVLLLKKSLMAGGSVREKMYFENPLYWSESFMERVPMFFYSIVFYIKMLLAPFPLVYYYGYDQIEIVGWENPFSWLGVLFVFGGLFFVVKRIAKKELWAFCFLFFMFGIGGAANLLFPVVGIVGERFMFLASFGFAFYFAHYGYELYQRVVNKNTRYLIIGVSCLLLITSFTQITSRNKDWQNRLSLYRHDIQNLSNSAKAHSLLGSEYVTIADSILRIPGSSHLEYISYIDSAISEFEVGLEIYNGYYNCANNAGALYFSRKNNHYKAKPYFLKALEYKPNYVEALYNYGNCLRNDLKGIDELQKILESVKIDSVNVLELETDATYESEINAAYAASAIRLKLNGFLNKLNLNSKNWNNYALNQISIMVNQCANVENGILRNGYNDADYIAFASSQLNKAFNGDVKSNLQQLVAASDSYFEGIINQNLETSSLSNSLYKETLKHNLDKHKSTLEDSVIVCWNLALEANSSYYLAYKSLMNLHLTNKRYDEVIKVCEKAISDAGLEDNTEFYVTIGNIYNNRKEYSNAIKYMGKTLQELDRVYAVIYRNERLKINKKQEILNKILSRKKQIYGFVSKIYYDSGDQTKAQEYQKLSKL